MKDGGQRAVVYCDGYDCDGCDGCDCDGCDDCDGDDCDDGGDDDGDDGVKLQLLSVVVAVAVVWQGSAGRSWSLPHSPQRE